MAYCLLTYPKLPPTGCYRDALFAHEVETNLERSYRFSQKYVIDAPIKVLPTPRTVRSLSRPANRLNPKRRARSRFRNMEHSMAINMHIFGICMVLKRISDSVIRNLE